MESNMPIVFPKCPHQQDGWCSREDCWSVANGECKWLEANVRVVGANNTSQSEGPRE